MLSISSLRSASRSVSPIGGLARLQRAAAQASEPNLHALEPAEAALQNEERAVIKTGDVGQIVVVDVVEVHGRRSFAGPHPAGMVARHIIKPFRERDRANPCRVRPASPSWLQGLALRRMRLAPGREASRRRDRPKDRWTIDRSVRCDAVRSKATSTEPCCSVPLDERHRFGITVAAAAERHAIAIEERPEAGALDAGWSACRRRSACPSSRRRNRKWPEGTCRRHREQAPTSRRSSAKATSAPSRRERRVFREVRQLRQTA